MKHPAYALLLIPIPLILLYLAFRIHPPMEQETVQPALSIPESLSIALTSTRTFDRETLADYIDGAADAYIEEGFTLCTVWEGTKGGTEIILERYTMESEASARAMLEREGGEFQSPEALAFISGPDYFKATLYPEDEALSRQVFQSLGKESNP